MLLNITEPQNSKNESEIERIVGIDFGTTNSLIAYCDYNGITIIPDESGNELIKSFIIVDDVSIPSIKRILGKNIEEIKAADFIPESLREVCNLNSEGNVALRIKDQLILPIEIASQIFKKLKNNAKSFFNEDVKKAVITVPAYFDDTAKTMVKDSARLAGFEVVRMLAEPTAAAYSYSLDKKSEGNYLVYDIGGGTFDISVLAMRMGAFQVLATGGDNHLGGDDLDQAICKYIKAKEGFDISLEEEIDFLSFGKKLKEEITKNKAAENIWKGRKISLNPEELKEIVLPIIAPTISIAKKAIRDSKIDKLQGIILVGGSTKLWVIQDLISSEFSEINIINNIDPDKSVVIGAAKQAWNIASKSGDILIDVVPLSLGIELMGGIVERIIPRNTPIPASVTKKYTTYVDNQTGFDFHIVQGDREFAADCRSLARFSLKSLPPMIAGKAIVEVSFNVDHDGLLAVNATEIITGKTQEVFVQPSYGLSHEKINEMLLDAMENVEDDHLAMKYAEKVIEIDGVILKISKLLEENADLLEKNEYNILKEEIIDLQETTKSNNYKILMDKFDKLQQKFEFFAEKIMSKELTNYLSGKKANEFL